MTAHPLLTEWQKTKLLSTLPLGSDRPTACKYIGVSLAQLLAEMKRDRGFAQAVTRAEAEVDIRHLGNVFKASQDEKNWRTSVWWLERRDRERYSDDQSLTAAHVTELLDELALAITAEIEDEQLQRRVIERLLDSLARREQLSPHCLPQDAALPAPLASPAPPFDNSLDPPQPNNGALDAANPTDSP